MKRDKRGRFVSKETQSEPEEKFMPLPWRIGEGGILKGDKFFVNVNDWQNPERMAATVALFFAAPKMYAELKALLNAMEKGLFPQVAPGVDHPVVMEKIRELRDLLKEARGEK